MSNAIVFEKACNRPMLNFGGRCAVLVIQFPSVPACASRGFTAVGDLDDPPAVAKIGTPLRQGVVVLYRMYYYSSELSLGW